jgi:uncharacterized protein with PIN domain
MPSRPAALYCDEDVSVVLAAMLRARGFPVTTARDAGHLGRTDEDQLQGAAAADWILLTHNRADFERLHRQWIESGRRHAGIIIARRRLPGELVVRLGRLLGRLTADDFTNQLFYA